MSSAKLKITFKDWITMGLIGALLGFLLGCIFYFFNPSLQNSSTLLFSTLNALSIVLWASLLITFSNFSVLPKLSERLWYAVSLFFSFLSGVLGFSMIFLLFYPLAFPIIEILTPHWYFIALICGALTLGIGLMLHWFMVLKNQQEQNEHLLLKSRLKALENELNPHFLFNALNSMSELVYIDAQKAENAILNLSCFLRNAIKNESLLALKEEMAMVKTYVQIENIRFEDKIILLLDIPLSYETHAIPKFSIQLLVENAIKHGFTGEALKIEIGIKNNAICVKNNGKMQKHLELGLGLKNLQQRLSLLNIGELSYNTQECMEFNIKLKGKLA